MEGCPKQGEVKSRGWVGVGCVRLPHHRLCVTSRHVTYGVQACLRDFALSALLHPHVRVHVHGPPSERASERASETNAPVRRTVYIFILQVIKKVLSHVLQLVHLLQPHLLLPIEVPTLNSKRLLGARAWLRLGKCQMHKIGAARARHRIDVCHFNPPA